MPHRPQRPEQFPAALSVAVAGALLGSFQAGYHIAVLNTSQEFIAQELGYGNTAVLASAVVLGAGIGALFSGRAADRLGPKKAQLFSIIPLAVGALLCALTPLNVSAFVAGRMLAGLGSGAASVLAPRYIAEIAPPRMRGKLGSQHQAVINAGILAAYLAGAPYARAFTGFYMSRWVGWWRIMQALALLPGVAQAAMLGASPESPAWLERQPGRSDDADRSCIKLWGAYAIAPEDQDDDPGSGSLEAAEPLLPGTAAQRALPLPAEGWRCLLLPAYRRVVLLAIALPLLQQASGINTVIYFSSEVFQDAGLEWPILGSVLMGALNLGVTLLAASLADTAGRRRLLLISFGGMAAALAAVAALGAVPGLVAGWRGGLQAGALLAYVAAFALGAGPVTWLYLSEILPPQIKGTVAAVATCGCWLGNLAITLTFPAMLDALGVGGSYALYAAANAAAFVYVRRAVVETKQRSLPEIERLLLGSLEP